MYMMYTRTCSEIHNLCMYMYMYICISTYVFCFEKVHVRTSSGQLQVEDTLCCRFHFKLIRRGPYSFH